MKIYKKGPFFQMRGEGAPVLDPPLKRSKYEPDYKFRHSEFLNKVTGWSLTYPSEKAS